MTKFNAAAALGELPTSYVSYTPYTDELLRDWCFRWVRADKLPFEGIATLGTGPFEETDLDDFCYDRGLSLYVPDEDTEILVIGREEWREDTLAELLDLRAGKQLKIYSQEMFLAYLASGRDPLADEAIARRFGAGHPALEFLSGIGFDWPTTFVAAGDGEFGVESPKVGLLKYMGYAVGQNGQAEEVRREILRRVFVSTLPIVASGSYMEEWGRPKSKERLQKMANSIASFCRNEKRQPNSSQLAVSDWEADLRWLKKTFYTGRFSFQWPRVPDFGIVSPIASTAQGACKYAGIKGQQFFSRVIVFNEAHGGRIKMPTELFAADDGSPLPHVVLNLPIIGEVVVKPNAGSGRGRLTNEWMRAMNLAAGDIIVYTRTEHGVYDVHIERNSDRR